VWSGESAQTRAVKGDTEAFGLLSADRTVSDIPRIARWQKPYRAIPGVPAVAIEELTATGSGQDSSTYAPTLEQQYDCKDFTIEIASAEENPHPMTVTISAVLMS
jgi:hypothetical protein